MSWSQPTFGAPKPHAVSNAPCTSAQRSSGNRQTTAPSRLRCASAMWSKLRAHTTGMPSSMVRTTSVVNPRIVRVAGATMISFRRSITPSRVRIRTGRRLSGSRNVYHRISPRLNQRSPSPLLPTRVVRHPRKTLHARAVSTCKGIRHCLAGRLSDAQDGAVPPGAEPPPMEGYRLP
jgi:hypothetical protein